MRMIGWFALALMGCGPSGNWNDAATDAGPDARPALTTAEMALVGTWARDTSAMGSGGDMLHVIEEFRSDHTARLTFQITTTCGMAATTTLDRRWSVDNGLLVVDPSAMCTVTNTSDACSVANAMDYCTQPEVGGMYSYSISGGTTLTIDPPAGGEGGTYTRQ